MYECFIYVHIFLPHPCSNRGGQKQGCYSFELELETVPSHAGWWEPNLSARVAGDLNHQVLAPAPLMLSDTGSCYVAQASVALTVSVSSSSVCLSQSVGDRGQCVLSQSPRADGVDSNCLSSLRYNAAAE